MTWRVNLEPVVFLGASRALLLQVAHPLIAAGVDRHSNYRERPWTRLFQTMDVMLKLAFGDPSTSARQRARLRATHRRIAGVSSDGVPYDALDPALMTWVWATLVDGSLQAYERTFGLIPPADRERFYQEQRSLGIACGIPDQALPASSQDFGRYVERVLTEDLRVTPEARSIAGSLFHIRRPPLIGWVVGSLNEVFAAGLLPDRIRRAYGLGWSGRRDRVVKLAFAAGRVAALVVPARGRRWPVMYLVRRSRPLGGPARRLPLRRSAPG